VVAVPGSRARVTAVARPRRAIDTVGPVAGPAVRSDDAQGAELLQRIGRGERDALYVLFGRRAYSLARRILSDETLAEDVVQEVFLSIWRNPAAFDARRAGVTSWLLAMVHHKAVDAVRREETHRRRRTAVADDLRLDEPVRTRDVQDDALDGLVAQQVRGALRELPEAQREALTLAYYGGYTQREVAALTGVPLGTVKTRMLAGMRKLRGALAPTAQPDGSTR
jgi:RNA polymerase sigma factor (sigma-70 family)